MRIKKARSKEEAKAVIRSLNVPSYYLEEEELNFFNQAFIFEYKEGGKIKLEIAFRPILHYSNGLFEVYINDAQRPQKEFNFTSESTFKTAFQQAKNYALQALEKL